MYIFVSGYSNSPVYHTNCKVTRIVGTCNPPVPGGSREPAQNSVLIRGKREARQGVKATSGGIVSTSHVDFIFLYSQSLLRTYICTRCAAVSTCRGWGKAWRSFLSAANLIRFCPLVLSARSGPFFSLLKLTVSCHAFYTIIIASLRQTDVPPVFDDSLPIVRLASKVSCRCLVSVSCVSVLCPPFSRLAQTRVGYDACAVRATHVLLDSPVALVSTPVSHCLSLHDNSQTHLCHGKVPGRTATHAP